MWIIMKKTYSGPWGLFPKGLKYDLPEATIEHLPKKSYKECKPPWEEQTDPKAIELAAARKTAANNLALVKMLESAIEKAKPRIAELVTIAAQKQAESDDANKKADAAVKAAEKKNATADDKAKAFNLANEANRKAFESGVAQGQLLIASDEGGLMQLDLDEAKRAVKETEPAADKPAEPEQITEPVPPPAEDIGEAEIPKTAEPEKAEESKTDGPEKTEKQPDK